jgi:hypothetical protein
MFHRRLQNRFLRQECAVSLSILPSPKRTSRQARINNLCNLGCDTDAGAGWQAQPSASAYDKYSQDASSQRTRRVCWVLPGAQLARIDRCD